MSPLKKNILKISQEILDYLLEFRKIHKDFTFSLRERDSVQSDEKRLEIGQWFQGSSYVYVPLFSKGDSDRKIKTLGFVLTFNDEGEIDDNYIEVSFKGGNDKPDERKFHEDLAKALNVKLNSLNFGQWHYEYPENYLENLKDYVTRVRSISLQLLKKYQIESDFVISESKFLKSLTKIEEIKKTLCPIKGSVAPQVICKNEENRNLILYGPPGTGKTYNTIIKSLAILESKSEEDLVNEQRSELKRRFIDYLNKERIFFTTFHQSMSYEDFIEGLKPDFDAAVNQMKYPVKSGIFKEVCLKAIKNVYNRNAEDQDIIDFDRVFELYIKYLKEEYNETDYPFTTKEGSRLRIGKDEIYDDYFRVYYEYSNNAVKKDPGKTAFPIKKSVLERMFLGGVTTNETNLKAALKKYTTYHLSPYYAAYKSLIDFINNRLGQKDSSLNKKIEESIEDELSFESYLEKLDQLSVGNQKKLEGDPFVLIIDEINRGNISQVFGELITLIEQGKRIGEIENLSVTLPYSRERFSVPANVYIVGTMNTADRSVEALDTALRRRFTFEFIPPDSTLLAGKIIGGIDLMVLLDKINDRVAYLLDDDHKIGHSYFFHIDTTEKLAQVFSKSIIPLLKEHFYNDFGKIRMVLGDGFVKKKASTDAKLKFAVKDENFIMDRPVYSIIEPKAETIVAALQQTLGDA